MNRQEDKNLDRLLRTRRIEPPSTDLAERIIRQARRTPQLEPLSPWQWLREVFAEFHLPSPAYVLTAVLAIGIVLGFTTAPEAPIATSRNSTSAQAFLSFDEGLL